MDLDLSKIKNVHFIGIGGIGISAIARMMVHEGKNVTGQDMQDGTIIDGLRKIGIDIKIGQSYENIPTDTDLVIYTIAIEYYDEKLFKKLKELGKYSEVGLPNMIKKRDIIFVKSYPEMLGFISKDKYTIAVCGTHGKTTTTGMIAQIFNSDEKNATVIVGSLLKDKEGNKTNFIGGKSNTLIVEACEYRRSFLKINPDIVAITNIDLDHLDYYKDIEDIKSAFRELVIKVPESGFIICNPDDKNIKDVVKDIKAKVINWNNYFDKNLELKIPGIHNKKDAAVAIATAVTTGISKANAEEYVQDFSGIWRRFEYKGKLKNGVIIYDDYAHHPTEIIASLQGFRELYPKEDGWRITVIFQPHLFSRTKLLLDDFAKSFKDTDEVLLLPIYSAREVDDDSINSIILAEEINKKTNNAKSFLSFKELEKYLKNKISSMGDKDIIITMGAGEAYKIGNYLLKR